MSPAMPHTLRAASGTRLRATDRRDIRFRTGYLETRTRCSPRRRSLQQPAGRRRVTRSRRSSAAQPPPRRPRRRVPGTTRCQRDVEHNGSVSWLARTCGRTGPHALATESTRASIPRASACRASRAGLAALLLSTIHARLYEQLAKIGRSRRTSGSSRSEGSRGAVQPQLLSAERDGRLRNAARSRERASNPRPSEASTPPDARGARLASLRARYDSESLASRRDPRCVAHRACGESLVLQSFYLGADETSPRWPATGRSTLRASAMGSRRRWRRHSRAISCARDLPRRRRTPSISRILRSRRVRRRC